MNQSFHRKGPDAGNQGSNNMEQNNSDGTSGSQEQRASDSWIHNPALGGINPAKLRMLSSLASQAKGKNQNDLLPFLMAAAAQSQSNQMSFNNDEIDAVISVMKIGKSPQEIQQIDRLCGLIRQFRQFKR